ncbi:O-Antigen ligase [compost metagenome]
MYKKEKLAPEIVAEKTSVIYWSVMSFVVLFLFWSPFHKALFNGNSYEFERPIYSSLVWSSIILFLLAIYFFFIWKLKTNRDALSVVVLLLPLTYLISLIPAASSYYASNMLYIQLIYAFFFIAGAYLAKNRLGNSIISTALISSGYVIVFFGLLHWLGNGKFAGSLVAWFSDVVLKGSNVGYNDAIMTDSNGIRLTSVFQYANSYAAYLIALLFGSLFLVSKSKKWTLVIINSFILVPVIISFFLTLSRGAIVVIPVILLIILFFLQLHRQILFLIHMGLAFIASFLILQKITDAGNQLHQQFSGSVSGSNWMLLLGVSIVMAGISFLIQKYVAPILESKLQRFEGRKLSQIFVPIGAIVIGLVGALLIFTDTGASKLLPDNLKTRLENINFAQHSVLERGTFYTDATKLFKEYPVLGAGGGAWGALYEKYQNNPYTSRQAHNFFLQYLVEVGIVGILIFVLFLGSIFFLYIRNYFKNKSETRDSHFLFFIIAISLLIHSAIDFDLSYVYLGIILFLSLGALVSNTGEEPMKWNLNKPVINKLYPALLLVLSLVMFFVSVRLLSANSSFKEAIEVTKTSNDYNTIMKPLNEAINLHPNHPNYLMPTQAFPGKIGILLQVYNQNKDEQFFEEAQRLLEDLQKKEPNNRQLISLQLSMYQTKNRIQEASDLANSKLVNYPWDITLYEDAIGLKAQLGITAKNDKNTEAMNSNWNEAFEIYNTILEKMKYLESLPKEQAQGRSFNITNRIALSLSQIYYFKGDYAAATNMLKPHVTDIFVDPANPPAAQLNVTVARWYLAILQKQNTNDQVLFDKLIAKDPAEKQQIEAIVKSETGVK